MRNQRTKANLALSGLAGLLMAITLLVTKPWGLFMAVALGVSVFATIMVGSRHDPFDVRFPAAAVFGAAAGLAVFLMPYTWVKWATWLIFIGEQTFLVSSILASRNYQFGFQNSFGLFVAAALSMFIGWLVALMAEPWIGVSVGLYLCAIFFRYFRDLDPKQKRDKYDGPVLKHGNG